MTTAAVVLAAGGSRRFGRTAKLLAPFHGRPLFEWSVGAALDAGFEATYVVVGAVPLPVPRGATTVPNPRWERGQATSLRAAVEAARRDGHGTLVVALADQPLLRASAWRAVAGAEGPIAVATYAGRAGHPVRLDAVVWPLLPGDGDAGARVLLRERPHLVTAVPCEGDPADVDTRPDLERLDALRADPPRNPEHTTSQSPHERM